MRFSLILALGIIGLLVASWCFAGIDQPSLVTDPTLIALITSTGDDVFATTNLTALLDPSGNATQHYGPYSSTSTDSGTCANDWANDTFDRHFTVRRNTDGTFLVVEQFKDGSFVTPASDSPPVNFSPGACQNGILPQGIVNNGVTGNLQGYFIIPGVTTQTSNSPYCDAAAMTDTNCDTFTFINTHFTPPCYPVKCMVTTFFFHYSAGDQTLIQHEWKNASPDRGWNNGDIRSSN